MAFSIVFVTVAGAGLVALRAGLSSGGDDDRRGVPPGVVSVGVLPVSRSPRVRLRAVDRAAVDVLQMMPGAGCRWHKKSASVGGWRGGWRVAFMLLLPGS